ncbi:MAG: hypothetical protein GEU78_07925 [Actinobacteria bacterium]|nr:hypothetical protein [Actinomycetota bacterium]
MGVDKLLRTATGGLLGGKPKSPNFIVRDTKGDDAAARQSGDVDPNRSDAVAQTRKRRLALAGRTGRSALRIDLAQGGSQTRSGISIG